MSKYAKPEEQQVAWKPTLKDARDLSEKFAMFKGQKVNGRYQTAFELFLEKEGVISFDQWGGKGIKNPLQYFRLNEINDLRKWLDEQEMEKLFVSFPEEKEAYEEKRRGWMADIRTLINTLKA